MNENCWNQIFRPTDLVFGWAGDVQLEIKLPWPGWCNRSGRITGRTFAGRSGLASGGICNRENADGDNIAKGRNPDQQKPHFELDGVRAPAAG